MMTNFRHIHRYGVLIPNKYEDVIQPLLESIERHIPKPLPQIVIVADGHQRSYGFTRVDYDEELFVFARAVNLGLKPLYSKNVILMNDDCVILEDDFFERLHLIAQNIPRIGVLSPLIKGCVGHPFQRWHERERWWGKLENHVQSINSKEPVCFPCVYLSRPMLNMLKTLAEHPYYGGEDTELCIRARRKGWKTAVTNSLHVQHGDGSPDLDCGRGRSWSVSYIKRFGGAGSPDAKTIDEYIQRNKKKESTL